MYSKRGEASQLPFSLPAKLEFPKNCTTGLWEKERIPEK